MPEQLKIIIDADVNSAIAGVKELSKVISLDFAKSTAAASTAANKLSSDVAASVQKIQTSLDSIRVKPIELSVASKGETAQLSELTKKLSGNVVVGVDFDTAVLNSEINNLNKKLQAGIDLTVNTQGARARVKELLAEISKLKEREVLLRADNKPVLNSIIEVEAVLKRIQGNIRLSADVTLVNAQIKEIQSKFAALVDPQINVLANTELAEVKIKDLLADLSTLKGSEIFIRANDAQALKVINEVETELKGILDKQINITVDPGSVTQASKLISGDFVKATEKASVAGFNLSERIAAATTRINASIDKMVADALGETNKLKTGFQGFKTDFGVLTFDSSKALADVQKLKDQLNSVRATPVTIPVNTTSAIERINLLEKELLNLQTLSVDPKISSTQLSLFEANIKRVKAEIASLKGAVVPVAVDTAAAQAKLTTLSETIETIRGKIEARKFFITTETDITKIAAYNKEIDRLEAKMRQIQNVGKKGFELFIVPGQVTRSVKDLSSSVAAFGGGVRTFIPPAIQGFTKLNSSVHPVITSLKNLEKQSKVTGAATAGAFGKAFQGLRSLAALIPGIGLGGIIGIAATAVNQLTEGFFEAAFGAGKLDKALDAASENIDKNAASILVYANALKSGSLSSADAAKVQRELIDQASEFQSAFKNNKLDVEELDKVLTQKYIPGLVKSIKVTAALGIVNDALADSIAQIAKGGTNFTFGQKIANFLGGLSQNVGIEFENITKNVEKAEDALKAENITKLIEDTFKSLGISFSDVAGEVDKGGTKLKAALDKQKADFERFRNEIISKARVFAKEFGEAFIVPNLEESFFVNKNEIFKRSQKLLSDVNSFLQGNIKALKIKIPVQTDFELLPITEPTISQDLIDGFFKGIEQERKIPIEIVPDLTISKASIDAINQKLDLRKQFSVLGDLGLKEFNKLFEGIDTNNFAQLSKGIEDATIKLQGMIAVATTLNQAIGQGLTNAFNSVFDAVLEGRSVFKALGNAIKALVVDTIKAIAQMLILKLVTNLIFPGAGAAGAGLGRALSGIGGAANFGQLSGISNRAFNNVIQVAVTGEIANDVIYISNQRAANSRGRFG